MRTTDPAWHIDELPQEDAGWRLMCNFGDLPVVQGDFD
jgi:hypothetical protein